MHMRFDDSFGLLVGCRHGTAGARRTRMRIRKKRQYVALKPFLDGPVAASAGRPIGIDDPVAPKGGLEELPAADDMVGERREIVFEREGARAGVILSLR